MLHSISYAPDSIRRAAERPVKEVGHPAWIVCRRLDQYSVRDDATLRMLAGLGRIRPDDFLVNTRDGSCVRAREIPELKAVFRSRTVRRIGKVSPLLARVVAAVWRSGV